MVLDPPVVILIFSWTVFRCSRRLKGGTLRLANRIWRHFLQHSPDTICWTWFRFDRQGMLKALTVEDLEKLLRLRYLWRGLFLSRRLMPPFSFFRGSGKKKAHKLKKILGTRPGVPWDSRRDKQGSTGRCPKDLLWLYYRKTDQKEQFCPGHRPGCPRNTRSTRVPAGCRKLCVCVCVCQGNTPWVVSACADCPGFLVLGAAPAPAGTWSREPQTVLLGWHFALRALDIAWICCLQRAGECVRARACARVRACVRVYVCVCVVRVGVGVCVCVCVCQKNAKF